MAFLYKRRKGPRYFYAIHVTIDVTKIEKKRTFDFIFDILYNLQKKNGDEFIRKFYVPQFEMHSVRFLVRYI